MPGPLLLVTATEPEGALLGAALEAARPLALPHGTALCGRLAGREAVWASFGVGKVNTALGLALAAERLRPAAVIQVGVGGAFPGAGLPVGSLAVAVEEVALDSGLLTAEGVRGMEALGFPLLPGDPPRWDVFPTDPALTALLADASGATRARFGTADAVTGDAALAARLEAARGVAVESMEGAAAAHACLALGLPFAELRGVSNGVGERDKGAWDLAGAVRRAAEAALEALASAIREGRL